MSESKYLTMRLYYPGSPRLALSDSLMMPNTIGYYLWLLLCTCGFVETTISRKDKKPLSQVQQFTGTPTHSCAGPPMSPIFCSTLESSAGDSLDPDSLLPWLRMPALCIRRQGTLLSNPPACAFSFGSHTIRATFAVKNCRWFGPVELSIFVSRGSLKPSVSLIITRTC